jgi:hypothetical protein
MPYLTLCQGALRCVHLERTLLPLAELVGERA